MTIISGAHEGIQGARLFSQRKRALSFCRSGAGIVDKTWPRARSGCPPPPRDLLYVQIGPLTAQRRVLVQREPNIRYGSTIPLGAEPRLIDHLRRFTAVPKLWIKGVQRYSAVCSPAPVGVVAGAAVVRRVFHPRRADRVVFTVARAGKQVGLGLHPRGLVADIRGPTVSNAAETTLPRPWRLAPNPTRRRDQNDALLPRRAFSALLHARTPFSLVRLG